MKVLLRMYDLKFVDGSLTKVPTNGTVNFITDQNIYLTSDQCSEFKSILEDLIHKKAIPSVLRDTELRINEYLNHLETMQQMLTEEVVGCFVIPTSYNFASYDQLG